MIPRIPVDDDPDDNGGPKPLWRRPRFLLVAGVSAVVLIYAFTRGGNQPKHAGEAAQKDAFIGEVVPYEAPKVVPAAAAATGNPLPSPPPLPQAPKFSAPPPPPTVTPATTPPALPAAPSPRQVMTDMTGRGQAPPHTRMIVYALPPLEKPPATPEVPPETGLGFKTATIPGFKASPAIDETYMLMPGLLPLVLDTAIQSDLPGPFAAHLYGPVYSKKGFPLMTAGTQIIGRYETMKNGGTRLMATSTYAHTPEGIWVPLSGEPAADDLGRAGMDGEVNNHYLQRFGGAVLLTLTDQFLQILQAEASKNGQTYLNFSGGGGGGGGVSSLAQQILQSQINIPPTFVKHQGESMALFLDQPIDFSASYRIRPIKAQP